MFWDTLATFVDTVGVLQQGNAQTKAAAFNAKMSEFNANATQQEGIMAEDAARRKAAYAIGQQRANIGASGFTGGSSDDVLADSMYQAQLEALTTRYNYNNKATSLRQQGQLQKSESKNAMYGTLIKASASLLKGSTSYYKNNTDYGAGSTLFKLGGGSSNQTVTSSGETITWDN